MTKALFRATTVLVVLLAMATLANAQTTSGSSHSDISRLVIHMDSYRPTPGDVYTLSINYGISVDTGTAARTENLPLILNADYTLDAPFIGSVNVRSLSYDELRDHITSRVRERSFAQFVTLNLTAPAIFDVLIWGGVGAPGFRSVTSLTRLTDAVAAAGGTQATGSRRKVELIRENRTTTYDLVTYLANGREDQNPFIRPGDRIYVPVAQSTVRVNGAVVRPGLFEILEGETLGDILSLAGGLLPTARIDRAGLTRVGDDNRYSIAEFPGPSATDLVLQSGDVVTIPSSTTTTDLVQVEGAIYTSPSVEGTPRAIPMQPVLLDVPFTPGITVLSLLEEFGGPTPFARTDRSFIIRAGTNERDPIPDLGEMWDERMWERDIALSPGDRLVIPMQRLVVSVGGQVNAPGAFSFTSGYVVSDYLELAGGIVEQDGSRNKIYFADSDGTLTRVDETAAVPAGTSILVGRSGWAETKLFFGNLFIVTGWVTGIIAVATSVIQFITLVSP